MQPEPLTPEKVLKLCDWTEPELLETKRGWKNLLRAKPTPAIQSLWNSIQRSELIALGVNIGPKYKRKHIEEVTWWRPPPANLHSSKLEQNLSLSRATDAEIDIPRPEGREFAPFQRAGVRYAMDKPGVLIGDEMGLGKELPTHCPVLTPTGWVEIGMLRPGLAVIGGSTGRACGVTGVFPQGRKRMYKITFDDGANVIAGANHQWAVRDDNDYRRRPGYWRTMMTLDLAANPTHWEIPICPPCHFLGSFNGDDGTPDEPLIPPYLLGALIGNGGMVSGLTFSTRHPEQIKLLEPLLPEGITFKGPFPSDPCKYTVSAQQRGDGNRLIAALRFMGLYGKQDYEKFIPQSYLFLPDPAQRLQLLQGLMDTDGTTKGARTRFATASPRLADEVKQLVRSLGGWAADSVIPQNDRSTRDSYITTIQMPDCPFRLTYHRSRYGPTKKRTVRKITSIEACGTDEAVCISVDDPQRLYVCNDYIVTHNTIQAYGVINAVGRLTKSKPHKKILIVCPNSVKINWQREGQLWLFEKLRIFQCQSGYGFPDFADIVIINYDILTKFTKELTRENYWDLVIVDEAHFIKNPETKRAQAVRAIKSRQRIALTGSPMPNTAKELFAIVNYLRPDVFPDFYKFQWKYCEGHTNDLDNCARLQKVLRESLMIRRLKRDVLKDLPPKRRQVIEIPVTHPLIDQERAHALGLLTDLFDDYKRLKATTNDQVYRDNLRNLTEAIAVAFEKMSEMRHEVARLMLPYMIKHLEGCIKEAGKVIAFAHHRDIIAAIAKHFGDDCVEHHGGMSPESKQVSVDEFQNRREINLFIGQTQTCIGINLTAASHEVFLEMDWVPATMMQAEDRAHRMGQTDSVNVQYLVLQRSLAARMAYTLADKMDLIDACLDEQTKSKLLNEPVIPDEL